MQTSVKTAAGIKLKTVREIAKDYDVQERWVRSWIRKGKFPVYRPDRIYLIDPADFNRFLTDSKRTIAVDPDVKALICGMFKQRTA